MDLDTYHGEAGGAGEAGGVEEVDGNDEMMEFALRRLERFFGIDRTQAYNAWVNPSSYAETVNGFQSIFAFVRLDIIRRIVIIAVCLFLFFF